MVLLLKALFTVVYRCLFRKETKANLLLAAPMLIQHVEQKTVERGPLVLTKPPLLDSLELKMLIDAHRLARRYPTSTRRLSGQQAFHRAGHCPSGTKLYLNLLL